MRRDVRRLLFSSRHHTWAGALGNYPESDVNEDAGVKGHFYFLPKVKLFVERGRIVDQKAVHSCLVGGKG